MSGDPNAPTNFLWGYVLGMRPDPAPWFMVAVGFAAGLAVPLVERVGLGLLALAAVAVVVEYVVMAVRRFCRELRRWRSANRKREARS